MTGARTTAACAADDGHAALVRNATPMHEQLHPATQASSYDMSLGARASAMARVPRALRTVTCGQAVAFLGPVVAWRWNANPAETKPNGASRQPAYTQHVQVIGRHACFAMCSSASPSRSARRQVHSRGQRLLVPANRPRQSRRAHANPVDVTRLTGVVCAPPSDERPTRGRFHSTQRGRFLYSSGAAQRAARTYASRPPAKLPAATASAAILFAAVSFATVPRAGSTRCDWKQSQRDRFACECAHVLHGTCAVYRQARTDLTRAPLRRDIARCGQSESRLGSTSRRMLRTVGHANSRACQLQSNPSHSKPCQSAILRSKPSARTFCSRVVFPSGVFHSVKLASAKLASARLASQHDVSRPRVPRHVRSPQRVYDCLATRARTVMGEIECGERTPSVVSDRLFSSARKSTPPGVTTEVKVIRGRQRFTETTWRCNALQNWQFVHQL